MIIYSNSGARPHADAIKAVMKLPKYGIVYIKDNKYISVPKPDMERLDEVFDNKRPYVICVNAQKNDRKITGCLNPFISCISGADTAFWKARKIYGIGKFLEHKDTPDVMYSNLTWMPRPPQPAVPKRNDGLNFNQREIVNLFTPAYDVPYAKWNALKKRWLRDYNGGEVIPFEYFGIFYTGKQGGWMINETKLGVDFSKMPYGGTKNKTIGKIEKYIMGFIKEEQDIVRKTSGFDYYDKEYYMNEVQAAWVVLTIVRMLKGRNVKITLDTLNQVMSRIELFRKPTINPAEALSTYAIQHIEHIVFNIL